MRAPRIVCVRAPDFGLAWWLSRHPEYAAQSVVQALGSQGSASVVAANSTACTYDVRSGLTVSQARARAPALHVEVRDETAEQERSRQVVTRLQTITPAVEEEVPGLWFLESLGQGRLYGDERSFIKRVFLVLKPFGVPVCVGLAGNRAVARVAALVSAPGSFVIVPEGSERKFLAALPSHHLAVPSLQPYLRALGLDTIHQVAELPTSQWAARFGASGETVQKLARGLEGLPFTPEALPDLLSQTEAFEFPLFCRITLVQRVEALLAPLLSRLASRQRAARSVRVNFDLEDGSSSSVVLALTRPTCVAGAFGRQLAHQLASLAPRAGVRGIVIHIVETDAVEVEQTVLSAPRKPTRVVPRELPTRASELRVPRVLSAALPEAAAEWCVPDGPPSRKRTRLKDEPHAELHCLSSVFGLRLYSPPRRITAVWSEGTLSALDGPDLCERVCSYRGPWIVSGGWWRQSFHRLYYEVDTANARYLVFYDRTGGHWHLQGVFD